MCMKTYYWLNQDRLPITSAHRNRRDIHHVNGVLKNISLRDLVNRSPWRRAFSPITCGIFAMMLLGLSPAIATAQTSVQGQGVGRNDPPYSDAHISVNAWLDTNGVAHGTVVWVGGTTPRRPGGRPTPGSSM